jgi:predicted transcriptional regulator of viral defense system
MPANAAPPQSITNVLDRSRAGPRTITNPHDFFATHSFFCREEFIDFYAAHGHSRGAALARLKYYVRKRTLIRLRRGVYMVWEGDFDAWLLPSKLTPLAVLAYDGAASFHDLSGLGYSLSFLAPRSMRYVFSDVIFHGITTPGLENVEQRERMGRRLTRDGYEVLVTSIARTIADCLDRLEWAPPVEELFEKLLDRANPIAFDADEAVRHALEQSGPAGCARLGLLLSSHPEHRHLRTHLDALSRRIPGHTVYGTQNREPGGFYFRRWHLVMPQPLARQLSND